MQCKFKIDKKPTQSCSEVQCINVSLTRNVTILWNHITLGTQD